MRLKLNNTIYIVCAIFLFFLSSCMQNEIELKEKDEEKIVTSYERNINDAETELNEILLGKTTRVNSIAPKNPILKNKFTLKVDGTSIDTRVGGMTRSDVDNSTNIHIFNFQGGGYAIMSGDTRVTPMLVLTDKGEIPQDGVIDNPNLVPFLANMEVQIIKEIDEFNENNRINENDEISVVYGKWEKTFSEMKEGYCPVEWGQGSPYNQFCPLTDGKLSSTGCVPTAVAQLLSVYKFPKRYNGYDFDWEIMNRYVKTWNPYPPAIPYIARIMQQLGLRQNLDVTYAKYPENETDENKGSYASTDNIPITLKNLGFSSGGIKKDYNETDIVNELRKGYYVLVSGYAKETKHKKKFLGITIKTWYSYSGGHCWLVHGLLEMSRSVFRIKNGQTIGSYIQRKYYLLCNMGWNGWDSGYYYSGAFNTDKGPETDFEKTRSNSKEDGNFRYKLSAITEIRK